MTRPYGNWKKSKPQEFSEEEKKEDVKAISVYTRLNNFKDNSTQTQPNIWFNLSATDVIVIVISLKYSYCLSIKECILLVYLYCNF